MATSTLFGYTLEETDGKLVITVHGAFAETATKYLREELAQGRGLFLMQRLSPIGHLGRLMTRRGLEAEESAEGLDLAEAGALSSDEILNQGIDQSLAAFEREMAELKVSLGAMKKDPGASTGSGGK